MARHRARPPLAEVLRDALRRRSEGPPANPETTTAAEDAQVKPTTAPLPAAACEALTERMERVLVEEVPSTPSAATLDYPDGSRLPVGYEYGGAEGSRQRWIALVPASARLVNGMVLRVERDTVLAVAVRDGAAAVHGLSR